MKSLFTFLLLFVVNFALLPSQGLAATDPFAEEANTQSEPSFLPVEQAYQVDLVENGDQLTAFWTIADGYYLYRERFAVSELNTATTSTLSAEYETGKIKHDEFFGETEVYYNATAIHISGFSNDAQAIFKIRSQGCADAGLCYPPRDQFFTRDGKGGFTELDAKTARAMAAGETNNTVTAASAPVGVASLLFILLSAALGGAILNLMPCVFPVLGLKVLSFANAHEGRPSGHGLSYTAGVVLSFIAVAGVLIGLQQAGQAVGWGFQLQSPWFVSALAGLFFVLSLNMLGLFEIGGSFMSLGGELTQKGGYQGSFFTGVLATLVASPCTAPFMGSAVGFAATQPPAISLLVFAALGLGMALPILLLTLFPRWLALLPKPGMWMVTLRQFMAFPLLATAIWLAWVVGRQTGANGMAANLLCWLLIGFALWLWQRKTLGKGLALLSLLAIPFLLANTFNADNSKQLQQQSGFDRSQIERFRENGQAVFLDVTADWCITCAANENLVLNTDEIQQAFAERNIVYLVADWTRYDPAITDLLADYQRNGVPLYLYFPADIAQPAVVLPQILTKEIVLSSLR
ncbi:protein-disulfide reductase DsbD [Spongiibacter sp. KMU-158]|uniref:Protein-disulfide reductase DsbD n=1 Tax=Spongiibacter pelagi TaxID=2760804 RepID=A0A927GW72_9GAMM|nr:protein-disulfide reductase DsbD [Spongiibacter pelagi]MBD2858647.1 protein-disulfide reductase DsbD [Spongiibacter pelagi]